MNLYTFRLVLALIGLLALFAVLGHAAITLSRDRKALAAAVTAGGAVAVAVTGLFWLLRVLGQTA